jgi:hypothetical protein
MVASSPGANSLAQKVFPILAEKTMHLNLETEIGHDSASRAHSGLLPNLNFHPGRDQNGPSLGSIPAARWAASWLCLIVNVGRMEGE